MYRLPLVAWVSIYSFWWRYWMAVWGNRVIPGNWNTTGSGLTSLAGSDGHPQHCLTPEERNIKKTNSLKEKHIYLIQYLQHFSLDLYNQHEKDTLNYTGRRDFEGYLNYKLSQTQLTLL